MDIFAVHKEDKSKAICLTCNKKVSRDGNNPKHFNMTNLEGVGGKPEAGYTIQLDCLE